MRLRLVFRAMIFLLWVSRRGLMVYLDRCIHTV